MSRARMRAQAWYSIVEAADHLGLSESEVRRMVDAGRLPSWRPSSRIIRIPKAALDELERAVMSGERSPAVSGDGPPQPP